MAPKNVNFLISDAFSVCHAASHPPR